MLPDKLFELNEKLKQLKKDTEVFHRAKSELENEVLDYLSLIEPELDERKRENKRLLVNKNILFKVYQEGGSFFGTHATKLSGRIHNNGYVYLETAKIMSPFNRFASSTYPLEFIGRISWDGQMHLDASKTKYQLFGSRIPEEFTGTIDGDGKVEIQLTKSVFEWSGEYYLHQILFDPFKGDEQKRSTFIANALFIKNRINSFIKEQLNH